eukprot:2895872-Prymnesium_polylepis.1
MGSTTQIHTQGASEATASEAHMMTQLRATGLTPLASRVGQYTGSGGRIGVRIITNTAVSHPACVMFAGTPLCTPTAIVPSVLFQKREN